MAIVVTYNVNKDLYYFPDTKHNISLITTEYAYKTDVLINLQIGKNLGIRLNNILSYDFKKDAPLQNEQLMFRKSYQSKDKTKPITRSTYEEKIKRFDMSKTATEQEIVDEYAYVNKCNHSDEVQIVITSRDGIMTAVIEFKDIEQYENFICPEWLEKLKE